MFTAIKTWFSTRDRGDISSVESKAILAGVICALSLFFGVAYGIREVLDGFPNPGLAFADFAMVLVLSGLLIALRVSKRSGAAAGAVAFALIPFFLYLLITGGEGGSGALWSYCFPVGAFFLIGRPLGTILCFLYAVFAAAFMFLPQCAQFASIYSFAFKIRFVSSMAVVSTVAYFYELVQSGALRSLNREVLRRREVEEDLREAKEQAEMLFEVVPSAVFSVDPEGNITSFNKTAEELTGFSADEIMSKHCSTLNINPCWDECPLLMLQNPRPQRNVRCSIRSKDGRPLVVIKNADFLRDQEGNVIGAIESFHDITAIEAAHESVVRSRDEAQRANAAKSSFLATVSHEIRTPLNGIVGMNTLLLDTKLDNEQESYAREINASSDSLLAIVNDILDLSKIEAGKLEFENIDFGIRNVVEGVMGLIAYKVQDKNIQVSTLVYSSVPEWLKGDPGRLRQVLMNLGGNAAKFTESGEISLTVTTDREDGDEIVLRFTVSDTGIGVDSQHQEDLFEPFSQADASVTRKYGGTGLGLAISKRLVDMMGGEINLESTNEGTVFWFTARFTRAPGHVLGAPKPKVNIAGLRVILICSEGRGREMLEHHLEAWGCKCIAVDHPQIALERLRSASESNAPIQFAIINAVLPAMTGIQLAKVIKSEDATKSTRVIIVTSVGQRGDAVQMLKAGVEGYLTQPVKESDLAGCLSMVASSKGNAGEDGAKGLITRHTVAEESKRKLARILIAEDNEVNQKVISKILEKAGFVCDIASNGMEAIEAHEEKEYSVILMDCHMPILSGYDATRAIREDEAERDGGKRIPIIALTADAMQGAREKCIEAGMDDYVSKPINRQFMIDTLDKWTSQNTVSEESNSAEDSA